MDDFDNIVFVVTLFVFGFPYLLVTNPWLLVSAHEKILQGLSRESSTIERCFGLVCVFFVSMYISSLEFLGGFGYTKTMITGMFYFLCCTITWVYHSDADQFGHRIALVSGFVVSLIIVSIHIWGLLPPRLRVNGCVVVGTFMASMAITTPKFFWMAFIVAGCAHARYVMSLQHRANLRQ